MATTITLTLLKSNGGEGGEEEVEFEFKNVDTIEMGEGSHYGIVKNPAKKVIAVFNVRRLLAITESNEDKTGFYLVINKDDRT